MLQENLKLLLCCPDKLYQDQLYQSENPLKNKKNPTYQDLKKNVYMNHIIIECSKLTQNVFEK